MKEVSLGSSILFAITHYHPPIRRKTIFKILIILICLLIFLLSMTHSTAGVSMQTSAALDSVIKQAEINYLKPIGWNFKNYMNRNPMVNVALVLGFALQPQWNAYAGNNKKLWSRFNAIEMDIHAFLSMLAKSRNYKDTNGEYMNGNSLQAVFKRAVSGQLDDVAEQMFRRDPKKIWQPFNLHLETDYKPHE